VERYVLKGGEVCVEGWRGVYCRVEVCGFTSLLFLYFHLLIYYPSTVLNYLCDI